MEEQEAEQSKAQQEEERAEAQNENEVQPQGRRRVPIIHNPDASASLAQRLHQESLAAKRDKTLTYDLHDENGGRERRLNLMAWVRAHAWTDRHHPRRPCPMSSSCV